MYIANADFQKHESGKFAQWTWFILYIDTTHFYNYIVGEETKTNWARFKSSPSSEADW